MAKSKLHSGALWQFRLSILIAFLPFIVFFSVLSAAVFNAGWFIFLLFLILIGILLAEIFARMSYDRWFYEFTDTNLKLERGIIWKRYSNIPYERVQNVDIHRGIIARIFGFSSVVIQTAGYSMPVHGRGIIAEGLIPAVSMEEAEKIRDFLMKKISRKGSGL